MIKSSGNCLQEILVWLCKLTKTKKTAFFFYSLFSILVACLSFNSYENVAKVVHNVVMLLLAEL